MILVLLATVGATVSDLKDVEQRLAKQKEAEQKAALRALVELELVSPEAEHV